MTKHVRKRKDGRGKPYYFVIQIDGQRHQTSDCVSEKEAADAGKMLCRLISKSQIFPPCTCTVSRPQRATPAVPDVSAPA